jgi:hypothetical protein
MSNELAGLEAAMIAHGMMFLSNSILHAGMGFKEWRNACYESYMNGKPYRDDPGFFYKIISKSSWEEFTKTGLVRPLTAFEFVKHPNLLDLRYNLEYILQMRNPSDIQQRIWVETKDQDKLLPVSYIERVFEWDAKKHDWIWRKELKPELS